MRPKPRCVLKTETADAPTGGMWGVGGREGEAPGDLAGGGAVRCEGRAVFGTPVAMPGGGRRGEPGVLREVGAGDADMGVASVRGARSLREEGAWSRGPRTETWALRQSEAGEK